MLALCLMLSKIYYAQNYAGIIGLSSAVPLPKLNHNHNHVTQDHVILKTGS